MLDDRAERVLVERDRSRAIFDPELWLDIGLRFRHAISMRLQLIGPLLASGEYGTHRLRYAPVETAALDENQRLSVIPVRSFCR